MLASYALYLSLNAQFPDKGPAPKLTVKPLKESGMYLSGESVGWTISPGFEYDPAVKYTYEIKENNNKPVASGELDLSSGSATISVKAGVPAMFFMRIQPTIGRFTNFGAAVDPEKLKPVVEKPKDFDAFWKRKIEDLRKIPEKLLVTPGAEDNETTEYATFQMDHVNATNVHGQWAKPKDNKKHPAIVIFQWASPPYPLHPSWVTELAKQGWYAVNVEPHNVLPREQQSYYQNLPNALKNYASIGMESRETSYFVEMYLRGVRAIDMVKKSPSWDGKTLVVMGTSMGGQQAIVAAGLNPSVTHLIANEPAGCDFNAGLNGRQNGYPFFPVGNPHVMEAARYVDAINFASAIKAKSLISMGFVDDVTPPTGIWTAFNLIKGQKEAAPMRDSPHNNLATPEQQSPISSRTQAWLGALVKGETIPPKN